MASTQVQNTHERAALPNERKRVDDKQASPTSPRAPANSLASEQSERDNACTSSGKAIQMSSRRPVKSQWRKTLRSRRPDRSEQQPNSSSRSKRPMKLHDSVDHEVADLRKFREQNYFETHGSCHTLASSRSSGSLQQYLLNERLFPEPVSRIRKQDLVVTMPPCATTQKKRIHYFPRYVVRQEKNMSNANYKRKRCQSCPLTGHAIDLGILKAKPPLNSLALKVDVPNRHYIVISKNPVMIFSANYKLGGRIMVLPVSGEGRCNISMYNLSTTHDVQLEAIERNGETYQKVKKYTIKLDPKNVKFEFDNLFNGDPVLGPEMLKFLNENSNLVYKEYKEPFEITFGTAFAHIADKVFTRVPYKKIYLT
ncbi:Protein takeout [Ooceraea biroi]|uniref:Protein takeout n=1 Tax=Ooceraea biroi TaxID=2015173 RepID=A0A026WQ59_OOCBI|nr:Protein takeout [Ooceraea biroi]